MISPIFAWIFYYSDLGVGDIDTGELVAETSIAVWNSEENDWKIVSGSDGIDLSLGTMANLASLPDTYKFYFRFEIKDENDIETLNYIFAEKITVEAGKIDSDGTFIKFTNSDIDEIDTKIDYYIADNANNCLKSAYLTDIQGLTPDAIGLTYNYAVQISQKNQLLTSPDGISSDNLLYLELELLLPELQSILKAIPITFMPYTLVFKILFNMEERTIA